MPPSPTSLRATVRRMENRMRIRTGRATAHVLFLAAIFATPAARAALTTGNIQGLVTDDIICNVPVRRRTYASGLTLAPGAATDPRGTTFNGATSLENNFLLDGINTTNVSHGFIGTPLTL